MVRVLGPVDCVWRGGSSAIGGQLERKLLGALSVSANHSVSSDHLVRILWGDLPPRSSVNTLQTYVCRLRQTIGHDRIRHEDHSYGLHVGPDELDALVFEAGVAEASVADGRPEQKLAVCKRALALWRGVPFGEFADEDPFRLEAIRLDELRLLVMELKLDCEISLGHEEMVVGMLQGLVEDYPYRERMWYLLVAALSMSGRRVEALRACSALREVLAEVGLEPTMEIQELERDVVSEAGKVRPRLQLPGP
jgi:DNA-binding SARP family transcriptional activator